MKNKFLIFFLIPCVVLLLSHSVEAGVGVWTDLGPENSWVKAIALNLDDVNNLQKIFIGRSFDDSCIGF